MRGLETITTTKQGVTGDLTRRWAVGPANCYYVYGCHDYDHYAYHHVLIIMIAMVEIVVIMIMMFIIITTLIMIVILIMNVTTQS